MIASISRRGSLNYCFSFFFWFCCAFIQSTDKTVSLICLFSMVKHGDVALFPIYYFSYCHSLPFCALDVVIQISIHGCWKNTFTVVLSLIISPLRKVGMPLLRWGGKWREDLKLWSLTRGQMMNGIQKYKRRLMLHLII